MAFFLDIASLDPSGDGVGRSGGREILVPFTIPGERVRVQSVAARGGVFTATQHEIVRASPHRVSPRCPHFGPDAEGGIGPCGGCTWQHIAYPEQLRLKSALVTRLVRDRVADAPAARTTIAATPVDDPWGYRQKVHFVFGASRQPPAASAPSTRVRTGALVMGHYERGSRRVIPVRECPVHDARGNAAAYRFRDAFVRAGAAASPEGSLRSIAFHVAYATPELLGTLVVARNDDKVVRSATRRVLDDADAPSSFHLNVHPRADAYVFGRDTRRVSGAGRLREAVAGTSFLVSPTAFFQTNVRAAEVLVRLVVDAIPAGARVLDLYAGAGLFALPLARRGDRVVAVEDNRLSVADGEASRRLNRIPDDCCRFMAQRTEQALRDLARRPAGAAFDAAVLDPPRQGCAPAALDALFRVIAPRTVVYVSCNPEALALELAEIVPLGYRIVSLQPVDMFPHTAHVETVAVLRRVRPS